MSNFNSIKSLTRTLKYTTIRTNSTSSTTSTIPITSSNLIATLIEPTPPSASTSTSSSSTPLDPSSSSLPTIRKVKSKRVTPTHILNPPTLPFAKHYPISPLPDSTHVATLQLRSHTTSITRLTFFTSFALRAARALGLPTSGIISLPTKISLYTTPRSPFAHKKSQENFWKKEHKRAIKVYDGNPQIVQAWLAYLRKEAMGGVGMKAQVITYKEPGWGMEMIKGEELRLSALEQEQQEVVEGGKEVEMLAKEIMAEMKEAEKSEQAAALIEAVVEEEVKEGSKVKEAEVVEKEEAKW